MVCWGQDHGPPGLDWIPGTIAEVLGVVIYIVHMEHWKKHADQIKGWISLQSSLKLLWIHPFRGFTPQVLRIPIHQQKVKLLSPL